MRKLILLSGILIICIIIINIFYKASSFSDKNNKNKNIINFCSFYSEGPPNDQGNNYSDLIPEVEKNATGYFNKITFYTPKILRELGYGKYVKEYPKYQLSAAWSPVEKIGLFSFRPVMFLHELSKMNDGDILIHRDMNWKKNPNYYNFDGYPELAERVLKECQFDFFVPPSNPSNQTKLNNYTKAKVIRELGENADIFKYVYTFHAYMFIMRKSAITIELLNEWKTAVENESWLNGDISDEPDQQANLHGLDQSILSVILYNWIRKQKYNIPKKYPFIRLRQEKNEIIKSDDQFYNYLKYL